MQSDIQVKLHKLLTDPDFLTLTRLRTRPNLFETLAASHTEMWHSAFIKWLIDPKSHLGLQEYPLKRFLFTVIHEGQVTTDTQKSNLTLADIEDMNLSDMEFETEYTDEDLISPGGGKARIDIIGESTTTQVALGKRASLRLLVENKIRAKESHDQTVTYYNFAQPSMNKFDHNLFVFLTPDDSQIANSEHFIQITYQQVCDNVIKPCLYHPSLPQESKYLIEQYLLNLGKPIRGGRVMALPNKDLCQRIYQTHKEILDEIFVSVKGEAPQGASPGSKIRSFSTTLQQLVDHHLLDLTDTLHAKYRGQEYVATLTRRNADDAVVILYNGEQHETPSSAATAITKTNLNGWNFWSAKDASSNKKSVLAELRRKLDLIQSNTNEVEE